MSEKRSRGSLGVRNPALMGVDERCRGDRRVPVDARLLGELDRFAGISGRILPAARVRLERRHHPQHNRQVALVAAVQRQADACPQAAAERQRNHPL